MGFLFVSKLQSLWPFPVSKFDDLRVSDELVRKLPLPDETKRFVYAVREPESQSVIYILSAQNLSERSARDAEYLIRAVQPDAVVAQVDFLVLSEIQVEETECNYDDDNPVPTSSFGVIKRCFFDKINKEKYESDAGNLVLREIFGTCFHGHLLAAKRAAKEVGSNFMVLDSSFLENPDAVNTSGEVEAGNKVQGLLTSLVPQKMGSSILPGSRRLCISNDVQSQVVKLLSSHMHSFQLKLMPSGSIPEVGPDEYQRIDNYEVPLFAQPVYPLLVDLHNIFAEMPSMGKALALVQKLFLDINRGEIVDTKIISEVYTFQIAVECLRIALNYAGRVPLKNLRNQNSGHVDFSELSVEDNGLLGLRKHWNTSVPPEIKDLVGIIVTNFTDDEETSNHSDKKQLLSKKPALTVGAGATAVLGASSLSKAVPASTLVKFVTFKVPPSVKLILTQTQKVLAIAVSKILGPSKLAARGLTTSAGNSSVLNAVAFAEKIRTVVHAAIASAEKTSFSAMRSAFYEIMRNRRVRPVGLLPWTTFGCSIASCTGLFIYGDGIEFAAESLPSASYIASLGCGIQNLHQASHAAMQTDGNKIQKSIDSCILIHTCNLQSLK
ncbi:hypothetical protein SLEP1_g31992 [Rubroshorea leprosula]|uniref:Uncharacterized protein n=1 Tax=Rubroshorea leprosula TaxID=152421 RepID=A0AAV5KBX2_9ROSI|nr:hypothetical protein SLEP1_g31992 [Rubroshorea leprosula]